MNQESNQSTDRHAIRANQLVIPRHGAAEVLRVTAVDLENPGADEVLVEVRAAGLNFADILARQGLYPDAPPLPACMGYEFSGIVVAGGKNVNTQWLGKAVFGLSRFNAQASHVCVPESQLFEKPEQLTFEEAAAIPVNYLTAWQLLIVMGALTHTDQVLIHNAGGGVGLAAIDIARHVGATIIGTASAGKHAFLAQRGVDHLIDYRKQDWLEALREITHGEGVELIIDPFGGSHWKTSYNALRSTGRLGMFGISSASATGMKGKLKLARTALTMPFFHPVSLMNDNKSVFGVNMGRLWHETPKVRAWMDEILKGVHAGWIRPHVDASFPFSRASEAHRYLEERKNKGKVVLVPE